jgi:hypothetical protein
MASALGARAPPAPASSRVTQVRRLPVAPALSRVSRASPNAGAIAN